MIYSEGNAGVESMPSTSCELPVSKRKSGDFDSLHPPATPRGSGLARIPPSENSSAAQTVMSTNTSARQQQSSNTSNNSPLLVNLLR